jgi:cardiolipin synthase
MSTPTYKRLTFANGSSLQVLMEATEAYPAMLAAINQAHHSILLANYCMMPGSAFERFNHALREAAGRSVVVRLMVDAYGSRHIDPQQLTAFHQAGIQLLWRRPLKFSQLIDYNHGLHKKLLIVDGQQGFTGGIGIGDFWERPTPSYPAAWRDTHFLLTGPVVAAMAAAFVQSWQDGGGRGLPSAIATIQPLATPEIKPCNSASTGFMRLTPIGQEVLDLVAATKSKLTITTAYFGPSRPVIQALQAAAGRGVQIRILTNGPHCTQASARDAGRHRYRPLLATGIHIYEYQPTVIHAKLITTDNATSMIGSANLNFRSLYHDEEFSLIIRSRELAVQLEKQFERDLQNALEIKPAEWSYRPAADKLRQAGWSLARYIF